MKTGTIIGRLALGLGIGASLALSLLTVTYAPALTGWKLAVLATEFGHWLWPVPAVLAGFSWRAAGPRRWRGLLAAGGAAAVALLLSPAVRGAWLARAVETRWRQSPLAAAAPSEPLFRAGELWWPSARRRMFSGEPTILNSRSISTGLRRVDAPRPASS